MNKFIRCTLVATLSATLISCGGERFSTNQAPGGTAIDTQSQKVSFTSGGASALSDALASNGDSVLDSVHSDNLPKEEKCWFSRK